MLLFTASLLSLFRLECLSLPVESREELCCNKPNKSFRCSEGAVDPVSEKVSIVKGERVKPERQWRQVRKRGNKTAPDKLMLCKRVSKAAIPRIL